MNEELKPCPFCGWEVKLATTTGDFRESDNHRIYCRNCGVGTRTYHEKELVVIKWNTRVNQPKKPDNWIPVSERLPDRNTASVLIHTKDGGIAEGQYYPTIRSWKQFRWSVENANVTHWMPMEELPKEDMDNE